MLDKIFPDTVWLPRLGDLELSKVYLDENKNVLALYQHRRWVGPGTKILRNLILGIRDGMLVHVAQADPRVETY